MMSLSDLPEQESARLADLSPMELARLLDVSVVEARMWLEQTDESLPFMQLTVEEVQHLRESGELYKEFPELSRVPEDVGARWRRLKKLFLDDPELSTRYPEVQELLFGGETVDNRPTPYGNSSMGTPQDYERVRRLEDLYLLGGRQWPHEPELDGARPAVLDNGQVLWLRPKAHKAFYGANGSDYTYGVKNMVVLEAPRRKGRAILAALTALECWSPVDMELLRKALPLLEPPLEDGLGKRWHEVLIKLTKEGRREETNALHKAIRSSSPQYVMFLLRCYRQGFDDYPHEKQLALIEEGCQRINEFLTAIRRLGEFLEYGAPNKDQRKGVENAARDVEAAVLRDCLGLTLPQISERMRVVFPTKALDKGDYSTVSKGVKNGRDILERAWGKEGWRKYAGAARARVGWLKSLSPEERRKQIVTELKAEM